MLLPMVVCGRSLAPANKSFFSNDRDFKTSLKPVVPLHGISRLYNAPPETTVSRVARRYAIFTINDSKNPRHDFCIERKKTEKSVHVVFISTHSYKNYEL